MMEIMVANTLAALALVCIHTEKEMVRIIYNLGQRLLSGLVVCRRPPCFLSKCQAGNCMKRVLILGLPACRVVFCAQEVADLTKEALKVLPKALQDPASVLLDVCAYAGTGNVLKVQNILHMCSEHVDKEETEV